MSAEAVITRRELAAALGVKTETIAKWDRLGKGPPGRQYSTKTLVVYPLEAAEAWKRERWSTLRVTSRAPMHAARPRKAKD